MISSYLPGTGVNHDPEGGSPRVRLFHCTEEELTSTITPNVGNSSASFLLVGDCVRAIPCCSLMFSTFELNQAGNAGHSVGYEMQQFSVGCLITEVATAPFCFLSKVWQVGTLNLELEKT